MPTINKPKKKVTVHKKRGKNIEIAKLYNSQNWKKLRDAYFMEHPLCEDCLEKGIIEPTAEIHHIKPISTGSDLLEMKDLAYNPANLKALCVKCHHEVHKTLKN